ncbi:MAG: phosphoribosyltransferase family protein [Chloroflexota bacterium]
MSILRIISYASKPFYDREEAGRLLAGELQGFTGAETVVLGIPRGGFVIAREIAHALSARLDIVLSRKLGAPGNPELAIGAVAEDGRLFLHEEMIQRLRISDTYLEQEKQRQVAEIARRTGLIRRILPRVSLEGKLTIITDDGVATGATMHAALWTARQEHPRRLVTALPVGPEETLRNLARDADETICLRSPPGFVAVGQFYTRFSQVEDDEIIAMIKDEQQRKKNGREKNHG